MKLPFLPFDFEPRTAAAHQTMVRVMNPDDQQRAIPQGQLRRLPTVFAELDDISPAQPHTRRPDAPAA